MSFSAASGSSPRDDLFGTDIGPTPLGDDVIGPVL